MSHVKFSGVLSLYYLHKQKGGDLNKSRKIVVSGTQKELDSFKNYIVKYNQDLQDRNVKIEYKKSSNFLVELFGYDGELKKSINKQDIDLLLKEIDSMSMGKIEKILREKFI